MSKSVLTRKIILFYQNVKLWIGETLRLWKLKKIHSDRKQRHLKNNNCQYDWIQGMLLQANYSSTKKYFCLYICVKFQIRIVMKWRWKTFFYNIYIISCYVTTTESQKFLIKSSEELHSESSYHYLVWWRPRCPIGGLVTVLSRGSVRKSVGNSVNWQIPF